MRLLKIISIAGALALSAANCLILPGTGSFVSEGSPASPVQLSYNTPHTGSVDGASSSYYVYYAASSLTTYIAELSGMTSDADLYTYSDDSSFTTSDCSSAAAGTSNELCTTNSGSFSQVYIEVRPFSSTGTNFSLVVY